MAADTALYNVSTTNSSFEAEIRRLYNQASFSPQKELNILHQFGLKDGMSVLELGSGPGFVSEWLSGAVPNGSLTCLELDPALIEYSEQYLKTKSRSAYRIVQGSILEMEFPDSTFDFAFARLVFVHMKDPVRAAKEVLRVLKPAGKLVVSDTDFALNHITDPHMPEVQPLLEKILTYQVSRGRPVMFGRRLWHILKLAGFRDIEIEAVVAHSGEKGIEWFYPQIDPDRIAPLIKEGVLSEEEMGVYRAAVENLMASDDPFYMRLLLMTAGEKP